MRSAIYFGRVTHARRGAVEHAFTHRHVLFCFALDELAQVFERRWLWSVERPNVASFARRDYFGEPRVQLADAVRARVRTEIGRDAPGPVLLVTQPRLFGFVFNPVSFYYCYDAGGTQLEAILAEITNTPWNERHAYVLDARSRTSDGRVRARFAKRFHVSPFQPLALEYEWECGEPGPELRVRMESFERGVSVFTADMHLERRALDGRALALALVLYPGFSLRTLAAIYFQALRLRAKRAPVFDHAPSVLGGMDIR